MVWLIALLCLGFVGLAGYYRGPVCAAFSTVGLLFAMMLSDPLSPLARRLLPVFGLQHPIWGLFVPKVIAFLAVLTIFKLVGNFLHQKLTVHYKYQKDERLLVKWERMYGRLGFCVGMINGAIYFFILMLPIYVAGYFTTEVYGADADAPGKIKMINHIRAGLHTVNLDRVLSAHDPVPPAIYQASDIVELVLHNPLLESRLAHYPPLLALSQQREILDLSSDIELQRMLQTQAQPSKILAYPKIQAIVTNATLVEQIRGIVGSDLSDLQEYLNTGKSPKYSSEKILGVWTIDLKATLAEERRRNPTMQPRQVLALRTNLIPAITGLSIIATVDNQVILKKLNPASTVSTAVDQGTWKKADDSYQVNLPNNKPDTTEISIQGEETLLLPRDGHVLIFGKEM